MIQNLGNNKESMVYIYILILFIVYYNYPKKFSVPIYNFTYNNKL